MFIVDTADTAVDGSTEAPNVKTGPAETEGVASNPNMVPLEIAEFVVPLPVEEVTRTGPPVGIRFVPLGETAGTDPA